MNIKSYVILIMILFSASVFSQDIDEKQVLIRQADRLSLSRKYKDAVELLDKVLLDNPGNVDVIEKKFNNLVLMAEYDEAKNFIDSSKHYLNDYDEARLEISLLLAQSKVKQAQKKSDQIIGKYSNKIAYYEKTARIFERYRHFEIAADIYSKARKIANDPYLFARQIAYGWENAGKYSLAVSEYLKHADKNKGYQNYVLSRIKNILTKNKESITAVEEFVQHNDNPIIIEIYAEALAFIGDNQASLQQFSRISDSRILRFAKQQQKYGNYEISLAAYELFIDRSADKAKSADASLDMANIYMATKNFEMAKQILNNIYNDKDLQSKQFRYRTRANMMCRQYLSQISLQIDQDAKQAKEYLIEAKNFTYNQKEKKELDFNLLNLDLLLGNFTEAKNLLQAVLADEEPETEIYKNGIYYRFMLSLFTESSESDSLLQELIITQPDNDWMNDALGLTILLGDLTDSATGGGVADSVKSQFLSIYRDFKLYRSSNQIISLKQLSEISNNEMLMVLGIDWSVLIGNMELAREFLTHEFSDQDFKEYVSLVDMEISDSAGRQTKAAEFLTLHPGSVFSPHFRRVLAQ